MRTDANRLRVLELSTRNAEKLVREAKNGPDRRHAADCLASSADELMAAADAIAGEGPSVLSLRIDEDPVRAMLGTRNVTVLRNYGPPALKRGWQSNMPTVGELLDVPTRELMGVPNFGAKGVARVEELREWVDEQSRKADPPSVSSKGGRDPLTILAEVEETMKHYDERRADPWNDVSDYIPDMTALIKELRGAILRGESPDVDRLDWLEEQRRGIEAATMDDQDGNPTRKLWIVDGADQSCLMYSIREAIDRAMASTNLSPVVEEEETTR